MVVVKLRALYQINHINSSNVMHRVPLEYILIKLTTLTTMTYIS